MQRPLVVADGVKLDAMLKMRARVTVMLKIRARHTRNRRSEEAGDKNIFFVYNI
jgi:hypothetical protein